MPPGPAFPRRERRCHVGAPWPGMTGVMASVRWIRCPAAAGRPRLPGQRLVATTSTRNGVMTLPTRRHDRSGRQESAATVPPSPPAHLDLRAGSQQTLDARGTLSPVRVARPHEIHRDPGAVIRHPEAHAVRLQPGADFTRQRPLAPSHGGRRFRPAAGARTSAQIPRVAGSTSQTTSAGRRTGRDRIDALRTATAPLRRDHGPVVTRREQSRDSCRCTRSRGRGSAADQRGDHSVLNRKWADPPEGIEIGPRQLGLEPRPRISSRAPVERLASAAEHQQDHIDQQIGEQEHA